MDGSLKTESSDPEKDLQIKEIQKKIRKEIQSEIEREKYKVGHRQKVRQINKEERKWRKISGEKFREGFSDPQKDLEVQK